jgi:uroporphyrinogen-III synthase
VTRATVGPRGEGAIKVVVTRARSQASTLVERLDSLGMDVIELPVIAIDNPADGGVALRQAAGRLASGHYAWVVLTSPNAVSRLADALGTEPLPGDVRWAVVGTGTAAALSAAGVTAELVASGSLAEALADEFPVAPSGVSSDPATTRVLFPRAETVRPVVAEGLAAKGWAVDEVIAYRTVAGDPDRAAIEQARGADAIAFTSSSTVTRAVALLGRAGVPSTVVSIGPQTSEAARDAGLTVAREASPHTLDGLVDALVGVLGDRSRERRAVLGSQQQQQQQ